MASTLKEIEKGIEHVKRKIFLKRNLIELIVMEIEEAEDKLKLLRKIKRDKTK